MMNKTELISCMAQKSGLSKRQAANALNSMIKILEDSLRRGDPVCITGLCTFECKKYAARTGRDLKTNTALTIPAREVPVCKISEVLKRRIRHGRF